jgi:chemotaxis protein methyltransferase CheR
MKDLELTDDIFWKFSRYVKKVAGINLHEGKRELLKARLGKVLRKRNIPSFQQYYDMVVNDSSGEEIRLLLDAISTNHTFFFRESDHFLFLQDRVFEILNNGMRIPVRELRIWSAGCSSGEEPYTIAITLSEVMRKLGNKGVDFKILATDLSTRVLEIASRGIYEQEKIKDVPHELKVRYFQKGVNKWKGYVRVKKEIREKVHFRRLNFMEDFYFRRPFHFIFCRNVMIYFDNPTKEMLVGKFCRYLEKNGYFIIGHSESLTGVRHDLKYLKPSIFQKR